MEFEISELKDIVKTELGTEIKSIRKIGEGGTSTVYLAEFRGKPERAALKVSAHKEILSEEARNIREITSRIDIGMPKVIFLHLGQADKPGVLCMEYNPGISASDPRFRRADKAMRMRFRQSVIENLQKLQSVHNDKFGPIDNAVYDTWDEYYKPFAQRVLDFALNTDLGRRLPACVRRCMKIAFLDYDKIFSGQYGAPTLTHGDYWLPNILADRDTMELTGVIDPFCVMWAEKDYELFALLASDEKKYGIYREYKRVSEIDDACDMKLEFYAVFNEIDWYSKTGHIHIPFIKMKARKLMRQMRKFHVV